MVLPHASRPCVLKTSQCWSGYISCWRFSWLLFSCRLVVMISILIIKFRFLFLKSVGRKITVMSRITKIYYKIYNDFNYSASSSTIITHISMLWPVKLERRCSRLFWNVNLKFIESTLYAEIYPLVIYISHGFVGHWQKRTWVWRILTKESAFIIAVG